MINPFTLQNDVDKLWSEATDVEDIKLENARHELVVSPFVHRMFQMDHDFWSRNFHIIDGEMWFRNLFKVRVMYKMEPMRVDWKPTDEPVDVDEQIFIAIHAERENGRFVYFDREGNPESWK